MELDNPHWNGINRVRNKFDLPPGDPANRVGEYFFATSPIHTQAESILELIDLYESHYDEDPEHPQLPNLQFRMLCLLRYLSRICSKETGNRRAEVLVGWDTDLEQGCEEQGNEIIGLLLAIRRELVSYIL